MVSCKQAQLIGNWHRPMPTSQNKLQTFTFNADGSFLLHNENSKEDAAIFMRMKIDNDNIKGTWKIIDGYLTTDINNNDGPIIIPTYKILKLNKKKLVLIDSFRKDELIYLRTTQKHS